MQQYVVSPSRAGRQKAPQALVRFLEHVRSLPAVEVVRIVGDPDSPKRVIMRAPEHSVADLKTQFGEHVIIESDQPLQMLR